MKPVIVVSAQRFFRGGTIVIVTDCLEYLSSHYADQYVIKALVFKKTLYPSLPGIEYIEFPKSRNSFLRRMYDEYFYFRKLSKQWKPYLWLSMQDSTPNVKAMVRAVYFNNALIFRGIIFSDLLKQPRIFLLTLLYKYFYSRNINSNNWVVVQQNWIREYFLSRYINLKGKVIISPPHIFHATGNFKYERLEGSSVFKFIYPAYPFVYKNFEIIFKAAAIFQNKINAEIILTLTGYENQYIQSLKKKYYFLNNIRYIGDQPKKDAFTLYQQSDCLLFPSKTETWGLPLSEFMQLDKMIIAADLPYARETIGKYDKVKFADPNDAEQWAQVMENAVNNNLLMDEAWTVKYEQPFAADWKELWAKWLLAT
jgi:glycosyltransferase involved in cell wall biosynthesis